MCREHYKKRYGNKTGYSIRFHRRRGEKPYKRAVQQFNNAVSGKRNIYTRYNTQMQRIKEIEPNSVDFFRWSLSPPISPVIIALFCGKMQWRG